MRPLSNPHAECVRQPLDGHLSVENLGVSIEGRPILSNVSLEVAQGEVVALLGRDGAGKTICFQALAGFVAVDSGRIALNGTDLTPMTADRRAMLGLAYLPEEVCIFRMLSVAENIEVALSAREMSDLERDAALERVLNTFALGALRGQLAITLSGGERRRCEVARAMAADPIFLMLDEPFRGLDPESVEEIKQVVGLLRHQNVGVLMTDYDLRDVFEIVDRAYVIHEGQVVFQGTPDELIVDPRSRHLFLGDGFSL